MFSQLLEWHGFYEPGRAVKKRHPNSTSKVPADQALQFGTVASAARKLFAIFQDRNVFAAVARLQFPDLAHIHNHRAVDTDKAIRIEPLGDAANPFSEQI